MRVNIQILAAVLSIGLLCNPAFGQRDASSETGPPVEPEAKTTELQQMKFMIQDKVFLIELPAWWNSVDVVCPDGMTDKEFSSYVKSECGKDTGTSETWKQAFKLWMERESRDEEPFPVYPAHCLQSGGHHLEAAKIFSNLQLLARFTKKQPWFETYLAHSAGKAYFQGGQDALAEVWFDKATQRIDSSDPAIKYYAERSSEHLNAIQAGMTPFGFNKSRRD